MKLLDKSGLEYYTSKVKNELTDYVQFTDYATASVGGVIKTTSNVGTSMSNGYLVLQAKNYSEYTNAGNNLFISKGTLENVITGKGLVSNTDYATAQKGGVVMVNSYYGAELYNGILLGSTKNYATYVNQPNSTIISKGTLENVLTATIGDIGTILDSINGESVGD